MLPNYQLFMFQAGIFFLTEYFYFNWDETSQLFLVVEPFLVVSILN